jgi:hypothetical protein
MSMPFDATLKDLGANHPADFLTLFDRTASGKLSLLNVDLSTVTAGADLVIGIGGPVHEIIHMDFQSGANDNKGRDMLAYSSLLHRHYKVPVHSILVLLRPSAAHSEVNGTIDYAARPGRGRMAFGYEIVHLWRMPAEDLLRGPPGILPLAVLGAMPEGVELADGLTEVVRRVWQRIVAEVAPGVAARLLRSAYELMNLLVKRNEARKIFAGVPDMRDSEVYQAIMDDGREEHAKKMIARLAHRRFGEDEAARARLESIHDQERLDRILERLAESPPTSWQDLLDTP